MTRDAHRIFVCTACRHFGSTWMPGYDLLQTVRRAVDTAVPVVGDDFQVAGMAHLEGCVRPCTAAFHATEKAAYVFGDVDPDADIDDLVAFADRLTSGEGGTRRHTPAAVIVAQASRAAVS